LLKEMKRLHDMAERTVIIDILVSWVRQSHNYLFPAYRKSKDPFLAPSRAYTILRTIEESFNRLVGEGVINLLGKVRLYDHWF